MNTNFFSRIQDLNVKGNWKIHLSPQEDGVWTMSVLFADEQCADTASKLIPPMVFKGTAAELDAGFFAAIETPVQKTAGLFANMEQYRQQVEMARQQSQMEKDKETKQKKEQEERKKKYDSQMKKVEEYETDKKYSLAISALPKAEQFPEQSDLIKKKLEELRRANGQLSLLED